MHKMPNNFPSNVTLIFTVAISCVQIVEEMTESNDLRNHPQGTLNTQKCPHKLASSQDFLL